MENGEKFPTLDPEKQEIMKGEEEEAAGVSAADYVDALEAGREEILTDEMKKYLKEVIHPAFIKEAQGSAESIVDMLQTLDAKSIVAESLVKDVMEKAAGSLTVPKEFEALTADSVGMREMSRKELKAALENKMTSLGADDQEIMTKLENVIESLEKAVPEAKDQAAA